MSFSVQIDRSSPTPIFRQLENQILEGIDSGDLKPGDQLPSQYEMARVCQVSRATIQKAIDRLVLEDIVYYQQGKGTFVARTPQHQHLPVLQSIGESLRMLGYKVHADLLIVEEVPAAAHVLDMLALNVPQSVIYIKRLLYVDSDPMVLQETFLDAERFQAIKDRDLRQESLTKLLQEIGETRITGSSLIVGAKDSNWEESRTLNIQAGMSLLGIGELDYDENEQPLRYNRNKMRSDRFRLIAKTIPDCKTSLEFRRQPGVVNIDLN